MKTGYLVGLAGMWQKKNKLPAITEKEFREQIRELCLLLGWKFHYTWTSIHSPKGFPDLVLRKPPRLIYAELKSENGKVIPSQQEWIDDLIACGQEAFIWRPNQVDEIVKILTERRT